MGTPARGTSADAVNQPTPEALERACQLLQAGTLILDQAPPDDLNTYRFVIKEQADQLARARADLEAKARLADVAGRQPLAGESASR